MPRAAKRTMGGKRRGAGRKPGTPKTGGRTKGTPNKIGRHLLSNVAGIRQLENTVGDPRASSNARLKAAMLLIEAADD